MECLDELEVRRVAMPEQVDDGIHGGAVVGDQGFLTPTNDRDVAVLDVDMDEGMPRAAASLDFGDKVGEFSKGMRQRTALAAANWRWRVCKARCVSTRASTSTSGPSCASRGARMKTQRRSAREAAQSPSTCAAKLFTWVP